MKKIILFFFSLLLNHWYSQAQSVPGSDTISKRIVLIGDAGQLTNGRHPVVDAVRSLIPLDSNTTVLFLGDNLYRNGLPDREYSNYRTARAVLDSQLSLVEGTKSKLWMIPGNHDWENGGRDGYNAVLRQQLYVSFLNKPNVRYVPEEGCPGPVEVSIGNDITVILFDSQWWLHPYQKPEIESDCNCKTTDEVVTQIQDIAAKNAKKLVILGCHHPFKSNGIHGGFFGLKQHIFPFTDIMKNLYIPLPILGSIYPISRSVFGSPQDIKYPAYQQMINDISSSIKRVAPNLIFISGHDHNLQLIRDSTYNYIVSGGGAKENRTSKSRKSLFNSTSEGFAVLEVSTNKTVTVTFYEVGDSVKKSTPFTLLNFSKPATNLDSIPKIAEEDPFLKYKDTTTQPVTKEFKAVSGLKRFFMGENYRPEWSTPVNMRVFNLNKEAGGFTIAGLGGGKQTQSLHLVSKKDKTEWVLRTVNKNPGQTIPETFRGTLAKDLLKELKSGSLPYAPLIVPGLTDALHIQAPHPQLFFVPDDPALGFYRDLFKDRVCMLEKSDPTFDGSNARTFSKIFNEMTDDGDHRPYQPEILRARLLDMIIADYDRHLDQWKWDTQDTGKGKIYLPIPRDRDQAFFYSNGAMLRLLSHHNVPFLKGFRANIPKINWLNYTARDFDRLFLTDLDDKEWNDQITYVKSHLTDSVIENAVRRLPKEVYPFHGKEIASRMISRRNIIGKEAMKYYKFLSRKVNILGTNKKEYFRVSDAGNGKIRVLVYQRERKDTNFVMYDRIFDPHVTKEIRMFGLNDKDVFLVDSNARSTIKLRMIGGEDYDTFDIKGHVESLLYDTKDSGNNIRNKSMAKNRFVSDEPVNQLSLFNFNYGYNRFPELRFDYNTDDHFFMGMGYSKRTYGFRNLPYASDQNLTALYDFEFKAVQFNYRGEFNHVTRSIDIIFDANVSQPSLRSFYGLGNHVKIDPSKPEGYYQVKYNKVEMEALIRKRFFEKFHVMFGPYYYHYNANYEDNRFGVLGKPGEVHLDSANIFSRKSYLGVKVSAVIDNRKPNTLFPTRGILWTNDIIGVRGMNNNSKNLISYTSDMTVYASFSDPAKVIFVLKTGWGRIINKNYEYFQALSMGLNEGLKGFRKDRYMGRAIFYSGIEMRVKVADVNSYIIPGQFGLTLFGNAGKVHSVYDLSRKWHAAWGAGFYYLPFNLFAFTGSVGFHGGEKTLHFSIGTQFNLTY